MRIPFIGSLFKGKDATNWMRSSLKVVGGSRGEVAPFSQAAAVNACQSWVYAAASINANAVAAQPLRLFVRSAAATRSIWNTRSVDAKRKAYLLGDSRNTPSIATMRKAIELGADFEEVTDSHPVLTLLHDVNPWMAGFDLTYLRTLYLELTGNAYLNVVSDDGGRPVELFPMPPQWTRIIPSDTQYIAGYRYGRDERSSTDFAPGEVLHFKRPNPRDPLYGMGKAEAAWGAIQQNAEAHLMDLAIYQNRAIPDFAVIVKGDASAADLENFESKVDERLRGSDKRGKFIAVTGDVTFQTLTMPPKDLAGRTDIVEEIAAIFGVPVSMMKANDPNLASAKAGYSQWREATILPLLRLDEDVLNQRLLPLFGIQGDAVLAYDDPVPSDRTADAVERGAAVVGGWRTPNEARSEEGYPPLDSDYANRLRGEPEPVAPEPATEPKASNDCVDSKLEILLDEGYDQVQALAMAQRLCGNHPKGCGCKEHHAPETKSRDWIDEGLRAYPMCSDTLVIKAAKDTFAKVERRAARAFTQRVGKVFDVAKKTAADFVRDNPNSATLADSLRTIIGSAEYASQIQAAAIPYMRTAVLGGAESAIASLGVDAEIFSPTNPEVRSFIATRAQQTGTGVLKNVTSRMVNIVGNGLQEGLGASDIADRLEAAGVDPARATTIARTEGSRAYSEGKAMQWKALGVTRMKWKVAPSPCPICVALQEQSDKSNGVVIGSPFVEKGESIEHESGTHTATNEAVTMPPAHPNCRCTTMAILDD